MMISVRCLMKWPDSSWPNILPSRRTSIRMLMAGYISLEPVFIGETVGVLAALWCNVFFFVFVCVSVCVFGCAWQSSGWTSGAWKEAVCVWECVCAFMSDSKANEDFAVFLLVMLILLYQGKVPVVRTPLSCESWYARAQWAQVRKRCWSTLVYTKVH